MRARTGPGQSGARPSVFEMFHLRRQYHVLCPGPFIEIENITDEHEQRCIYLKIRAYIRETPNWDVYKVIKVSHFFTMVTLEEYPSK